MERSLSCPRWKLLLVLGLAVAVPAAGCVPPTPATPMVRPTPTSTVTVMPTKATTMPAFTATTSPTLQPTFAVNLAWLQERTIFYEASDREAARPWIEIWRVNADGTEKRRLAHHELTPQEAQSDAPDGPLRHLTIFDLALSPDKSKVAYAMGIQERGVSSPDQPALWLVNVDGSQHRQVAHFPDSYRRVLDGIQWSRDGTRLAFSLYHPSSYGMREICILDVNKGTLERIEWAENVAWLPDDQRLSYIRWEWEEEKHSYRYHFCVLELAHQPWQPVCFPLESYWFRDRFDWSPDGKWFAFSQEWDGVYVGSAVATELHRLLKDDNAYGPVQWSPDGCMIAYFTWSPQLNAFTLRVVDAQDGRTVTEVARVALGVTWSSEGQALVVGGEDGNINVVFIPGGQSWKVPNAERASLPTW